MIHFEIPKNQSSIIKVIGVGGGGSNAVNYMHSLGIEGVDFVVCNTDSQALALSPIANKIQLGPHLTQGLGAGANPEIGKQASEESLEDIAKILKVNTRMAFITAGMGGGTGTGGAPVVAKICRELGILTVGIVTMPFTYEGRKRMKQAQEGIDKMREHVDTILIISNDKLRQQFGNLPFTKAFAKADDILATAAKCITDVINTTGQINVDFADVCTVMKNGGVAILGSASAEGEDRALHAVEQALNSPLLNDNDIRGAKWLLLNITSAPGEFEHTMDEAEAIQAYVQQQAGDSCDVILGMGHDPNLEGKIAVTVIATGFNHKEISSEIPIKKNEPEKIFIPLGGESPVNQVTPTPDKVDALAPKLVEKKPEVENFNPKPAFTIPTVDPNTTTNLGAKEVFTLSLTPQVDATEDTPETPSEVKKDTQEEIDSLKLIIKNEEPQKVVAQEPPVKIGEHYLTPQEVEERKRFEEQKKALEARAERLRRMSFNAPDVDGRDMEDIPAYVRKNIELDNSVASADTFFSNYSVGVDKNGENQDNSRATIHTINTFLDGKKPD